MAVRPSGPKPAVFLDRDGVVNAVELIDETATGPLSREALEIGSEVAGELERLREAGFVLPVVSNQPEVSRGRMTLDTVHSTNRLLMEMTPIDAVYFCPHDNDEDCVCRKPRPGLIHQAARDWAIDLGRSCLIGDRWVDIAAALAGGIDGILLETEYSWRKTSSGAPPGDLTPIFASPTLSGCVDFILESRRYG